MTLRVVKSSFCGVLVSRTCFDRRSIVSISDVRVRLEVLSLVRHLPLSLLHASKALIIRIDDVG